jgi:hypothetical protein
MKTTKVQVQVEPQVHKQFADLAGFLYPGMKRQEARNKLLNEVMKERIEKQKGNV